MFSRASHIAGRQLRMTRRSCRIASGQEGYPCAQRCTTRMPQRSLTSASSDPASPRRGNLLIGLGWTLLGLVAIDQALQYQQEQERAERSRILDAMQQEADDFNKTEWEMDVPTRFVCKVKLIDASLDGVKMLRGIRVGDEVEVMEESVGPREAYHLCRSVDKDGNVRSVGWYPVEFLDRL